jgi:aryl-alcohol dehydrogenase-like predicted oxidoreductase
MTLAAELNMSVTTLAVAWSKQHDFVASTIIGASSADQLEDSLKAADVVLADETLKRIDEITGRILYPMG